MELFNPDKDLPKTDEELLILEHFLNSAIGYDLAKLQTIKQRIQDNEVGTNPIGADLIDGKFQIYHEYVNYSKEPRISPEDLLKLIEKWYELVSAKVDKIVITSDNGTFSIGTE